MNLSGHSYRGAAGGLSPWSLWPLHADLWIMLSCTLFLIPFSLQVLVRQLQVSLFSKLKDFFLAVPQHPFRGPTKIHAHNPKPHWLKMVLQLAYTFLPRPAKTDSSHTLRVGRKGHWHLPLLDVLKPFCSNPSLYCSSLLWDLAWDILQLTEGIP